MYKSVARVAALMVVSCAAEPAPPAAAPLPSGAPEPPLTAARPPAEPSFEPTTLSDAQKARDAARVPLATSVVTAYANWDGFFSSLVANYSPDGKHVLFGSIRDGLPEIYEGDTTRISEPPRAVTARPERSIWAQYTRDGKSILFLRDSKGDENHHIYRVNVDGSGLVDLAPAGSAPMHRGEAIIPRALPDTMFFDARSTKGPETLIFTQRIAGGDERLVFKTSHPGGLDGVSDDGKRALVEELQTIDDKTLDEIDVATGHATRVYPPEGMKVGIHGAAYLGGGKQILISTDEGRESAVVLLLDRASRRELARYVSDSPKTARIYLRPSPTGDRIALSVDCGNHGEVRVLDGRTLKMQRNVPVPLGEVHVGGFREDGKSFSILVSQPDRPADIFAVDAGSGVIKPLRDDPRPGLDGLPPIEASLTTVPAFDGLSIPVNLYLPKRGAPHKLPTLVIFHGGPATSYAIRWNAYARFFLSLGYAVMEPNVRGSSGFGRAYESADNREKRADWLRDVESVNAWAKTQPWCDPERVIVWGQSYGGYTTLMALTRQPLLWRAGVDLYGVADLKAFLRTTDAGIRDAFVSEFGDVEKDGELLDRFSPMRDVDKIVVPLFVYAGENDPRVPRSESNAIVMALRKRTVPVEYMVAASEGHTVDRNETRIELLTRAARFLEDATRGPSLVGVQAESPSSGK